MENKNNNANTESYCTESEDKKVTPVTPVTPVTYPHTPVKVYDNAKTSKKDIIKDFKGQTIIYLWYNKITGKVYIGSGLDGSSRLSRYFMPSVLKSNSRIYKSILKYGHDSFSVIVLEVVGDSNSVSKAHYLAREQFYLDWALKTYGLLVLNLLHETSSSLGFKHSLETKNRISVVRTGSKHSETTKQDLREMFSGEKNPFWGKSHSPETIAKLSNLKKGEKNPMFGKPKSDAFLAQQTKDKTGANNPQYGVKKTEETLAKLRKLVYVYCVADNYKLEGVYSTVECFRKFNMGYNTLNKRLSDGKIHKGYFFSKGPYSPSS